MEENMFSPNVCIDVYLCIKHVSKIIYIYNQWLLENFSWRSHRHTVRHSNFFQVQIHCACQWILTLAPKILHLDNNRFSKTFFYNTNHTPPTSIDVWMMDSSWINTRIKTIGPRRTAFCVESDFVKNTRFATAKEQFLYLDNTLFKEPTYLQLINCFFSWISVLQRWPTARQETTAEDQADPVSWQQMSRLIDYIWADGRFWFWADADVKGVGMCIFTMS